MLFFQKRLLPVLVNSCLAVGTIIVGLVTLEFGIRSLGLAPDIFLQVDSDTGVWHIPGKNGVYFHKDIPKTPVSISSAGLRDREYTISKPQGTYRIALLGDSFTEAIHVPLEATYQQQVENMLNARNTTTRHFEILNFGVGGFSTSQEYQVFRYRVKPYHPDMVILAFMLGNDIFENSPQLNGRQYLPYFTLGSDGTLHYLPPRPVPVYMRAGEYIRLISFVYYRIVDGNARLERVLRGIHRMEQEQSGIPMPYMMYAPQWNSTWDEAWEITRKVLLRLHDEVLAEHMKFFVIAVPDHIQVDAEFRQDVVKTYPAMQDQVWVWDKPNRLLREFCHTHDISFFDLSPAFHEHIAQQKSPPYYHDDGHWNEIGHSIAAHALTRPLLSEIP